MKKYYQTYIKGKYPYFLTYETNNISFKTNLSYRQGSVKNIV